MIDKDKLIAAMSAAIYYPDNPCWVALQHEDDELRVKIREQAEAALKALCSELPEPLPTKTETSDDLLNYMCDSTIKAVRGAMFYEELKKMGE